MSQPLPPARPARGTCRVDGSNDYSTRQRCVLNICVILGNICPSFAIRYINDDSVLRLIMALHRLHHLHLPGLTVYEQAARIQEDIVKRHIARRIGQGGTGIVEQHRNVLSPQVLTFQTPPTYTCGRREVGKLSTEQVSHLKAGGKAEFHEAQRGGQTTFHGPGQLTAYLICNLLTHGLTSRTYVHLLEQSVINTCRRYGIETECTKNPGVWTKSDDKIASVGVHLRRYISSHGIALNISPDLSWFDRIVACGLPEKKATSFDREGVKGIELDDVAKTYAKCVAELLQDVHGVEIIKTKTDEGVRPDTQ